MSACHLLHICPIISTIFLPLLSIFSSSIDLIWIFTMENHARIKNGRKNMNWFVTHVDFDKIESFFDTFIHLWRSLHYLVGDKRSVPVIAPIVCHFWHLNDQMWLNEEINLRPETIHITYKKLNFSWFIEQLAHKNE